VATFAQAYHYMTSCPLQQKDENPIPVSPLAEWFMEYTLDIFMDMFRTDGDYVQVSAAFDERLNQVEKTRPIYDKRLKIRLFQQAAVNTSLFVKERIQTPFKPIGSFKGGSMEAVVHLSRLKPNNTLELIWFVFEPVLPALDVQNIYAFYVNWNARAFELAFGVRPYRLTLYFPLIGDSIPYIYNTTNGMDVVAEHIEREVFYANPELERCSACRACPEYLRMQW